MNKDHFPFGPKKYIYTTKKMDSMFLCFNTGKRDFPELSISLDLIYSK